MNEHQPKPIYDGAPPAPTVGMIVTVRGKLCRIFKIRPFGTIDVVSLDGEHAWRVTGLPFL